jgi:hypothetical protein
LKFKDIVEGSMVYYHQSNEELRYPVKVIEKGYDEGEKAPYVVITNPLEPGTICTGAGNLSTYGETHCLNCFRTLDFGMPNICKKCGRIQCPDCNACHCGTPFDRNKGRKKKFSRGRLKST